MFPDECLSHGMCLYQVMMTLHFLNDKNYIIIASLKSETMYKLADSFKKGCCQLQAKVCARITSYPLVQACPGKSVVR